MDSFLKIFKVLKTSERTIKVLNLISVIIMIYSIIYSVLQISVLCSKKK
ncbi:hypothetical protein SDC9_204073 [bioreactor metagenome]|uniref:Uncharacterized protein n=1 Tax=bioreactor metagenome TaxID=1076179 RepID=A0A645IY71_9ZZZZ